MAIGCTLVLALVGALPTEAGVVGYWTFDADNINDSSGNGYDGTNNGGSFSNDVPAALGAGRSVNFGGGDNYAIIDSAGAEAPFDLRDGITVSAWVKGWPDGGWEPFVSKRGESGQGWQLRRHGGNDEATFTTRGMGNEDPRGATDINNSNWKHVLGTYNGSTKSLYVNGNLDNQVGSTGRISNTDSLVVFSARDNSGTGSPPNIGNYSRIQMDDVTIYDHGLAPNQAAHLASGGDPTSLPDPDFPAGTLFAAGPHGPGGTWNVYARVPQSASWDQHRFNATLRRYTGLPGHLATIKDGAENATVQALASGNPWIGFTDSGATSPIDGTTLPGSEGNFTWVNGDPVGFTNWNGGEPNDSGGEDATQITGGGGWNDSGAGASLGQGNTTAPGVVEFETNLASAPLLPGRPQLDPVTGEYYQPGAGNATWDEARVLAAQQLAIDAVTGKAVIGHLATIGDATENQTVRYVGGGGDKWIGLTDSDQTSTLDGRVFPGPEGTFSWITGEPFVFSNWGGGEPNNSGGEDAAHIRGDGQWNDQDAGGSLGEANDRLGYVVEYDGLARDGDTFYYLERKAAGSFTGDGQINSLAEAKQLLGLPSGHSDIADEAEARVHAISFHDPQQGGGRSGFEFYKHAFLTDTSGSDDDFAVFASAPLIIPEAGDYTFAVSHDDHFQLILRNALGTALDFTQTSTGNPTLIPVNLAKSIYDLELYWHERGGGAYLQLFAAKGTYGGFDANVFALVNDVQYGGLEIAPEPGTMSLLALGAGIAALRRRRRRKSA
jgi:hypothetical protein